MAIVVTVANTFSTAGLALVILTSYGPFASVYEQPYVEICNTLFGRPDAWQRLKEQSYARFISTTAIRGISIDDAIIIVDECQSMTWHELSSVITRTGHRSKIIFVGDLKQNDLVKTRNDVSGLQDFLRVAETMPEFTCINFTSDTDGEYIVLLIGTRKDKWAEFAWNGVERYKSASKNNHTF